MLCKSKILLYAMYTIVSTLEASSNRIDESMDELLIISSGRDSNWLSVFSFHYSQYSDDNIVDNEERQHRSKANSTLLCNDRSS
ncbi:hypothetical protein F5Y13DRAFT_124998 [Hypoxylon sp. FL1857]|nr:hypothetical protein F5Y13DRAFT_124998 [Hypoxylon sp. FL1857]